MIRWNPDGTPDLDDDGSPQRSGRTRTVRADRLSSDSKKDAEEHRKTERSDRVVTQARPSGQTEWSYNRLWWVLVGRSSDQRRQVRHPQELRPEWAVFFVVPYLSGTSRYWSPVVAARWLLGRWLWRWLQANWAWAADVILRLRIPLSFSWTRFGCVFSRIFLTGGCLPSFSELETYFGLAHSSQLSRPVPGRLLGPRIFLHLTRTRNFSSSRQP